MRLPLLPVVLLVVAATVCEWAPAGESEARRVFHAARPGALESARRRAAAGDRSLRDSISRLVAEADDLLDEPPPSVTQKTHLAPSGDRHDYASLAPYYWPDPQTADGLPYVRRDGHRNPESRDASFSDRERLSVLGHGVETLSLAWFFTRNDSYARHAARFARTWFIAENTRMNPHLRFAQAVRGVNDGRAAGVLEGRHLSQAIDALALLADSTALTVDERQRIDAWGSDYLAWLVSSESGRDECAAGNNHGTYYDLQLATMALALGRDDQALKVLREVGPRRIAMQIEPDGSQPREIARTRSLGYSLFNLHGLCRLATLGEHAGIDLWHFSTADGRSIRRAIDFLRPALGKSPRPWPHEQITPISPDDSASILWQAALVYGDPPVGALATDRCAERDRIRLYFVAEPVGSPAATGH